MDSLEPIKRKIYEIRGRRVMLDSDLAEMYQVETKNLKRAVRANIERFPDDFMFELTKEEFDSLRCKNFTSNNEDDALRCKNFTSNKRGGNRYLPFAFTREGIAMLSGLLRSEVAIQANINIMRAFFQMQEALLIVSNTQLQLEQIRSEIKQLRTDMNDTLADQNKLEKNKTAKISGGIDDQEYTLPQAIGILVLSHGIDIVAPGIIRDLRRFGHDHTAGELPKKRFRQFIQQFFHDLFVFFCRNHPVSNGEDPFGPSRLSVHSAGMRFGNCQSISPDRRGINGNLENSGAFRVESSMMGDTFLEKIRRSFLGRI